MMNISKASRASGVSAKMIRHYETLGLLPGAPRTEAGYRQYDDTAVHLLRFVRRARDLGFDTREIAELLALWRNKRRSSEQVKRIATAHVTALQQRIEQLQSMQRTLRHLAHRCHGDARPECPILEDLAGEAPTTPGVGAPAAAGGRALSGSSSA